MNIQAHEKSRSAVARFLGFFSRPSRLKAIETLCNTRGSTGGLIKRIDENRELLEVLQRDSPAFLADHPWVVGWIAANDAFFCQLNAVIRSRQPGLSLAYPRPWPEFSNIRDSEHSRSAAQSRELHVESASGG